MTSAIVHKNEFTYCKEHQLNRFMLTTMLRFMKYRLNHQHGIFTDVGEAKKINTIVNTELNCTVINDLMQELINSRSNPAEFQKVVKQAKSEFTCVEEVAITLMAQWRMRLTMIKLMQHGADHDTILVQERERIGREAAAETFLHVEHAIRILADNDEVLKGIRPYTVVELANFNRDTLESLAHSVNYANFEKICGSQGVLAMLLIQHHSMLLLQKAIEANDKPNDYDSN